MKRFSLIYHPLVLREDRDRLGEFEWQRIGKAIERRLTTFPERFGKPLQGDLKGMWSLRVGDWRVIYEISGEQVRILRIGHRREVYGMRGREIKD